MKRKASIVGIILFAATTTGLFLIQENGLQHRPGAPEKPHPGDHTDIGRDTSSTEESLSTSTGEKAQSANGVTRQTSARFRHPEPNRGSLKILSLHENPPGLYFIHSQQILGDSRDDPEARVKLRSATKAVGVSFETPVIIFDADTNTGSSASLILFGGSQLDLTERVRKEYQLSKANLTETQSTGLDHD